MTPWRHSPTHRSWLLDQANRLFDFYQFAALNPRGGFFDLDIEGRPFGNVRQLHATTRMVHCMAIGHLLGRPGCDALIDHGMDYIWNRHRDQKHGGYVWSLDDDNPVDSNKQAYGHAFVLLAASSAKCVGHPLADRLLADVSDVLHTRFWDEKSGAQKEEFAADWSPISNYRGQNSNMHLTEALMAAFEATGDTEYLRKAESIASLIIGKHAASLEYRVGEHFDANWAARQDLLRRRHFPARWNHAGPLVGMVPPAHAALGIGWPQTRLAARRCRKTVPLVDCSRLGQQKGRLFLYARLG